MKNETSLLLEGAIQDYSNKKSFTWRFKECAWINLKLHGLQWRPAQEALRTSERLAKVTKVKEILDEFIKAKIEKISAWKDKDH